MGILWALFRTARPRQWIKNAALLAPVVFSGLLLVPGRLEKVVEAIVVFTLISASVYIFNDFNEPMDNIIKKSDEALYDAKNGGRDRYSIFFN